MGGVTLGVTGALVNDCDTAMSFNGSTGYVNVPSAANLNITGDLTLEAWAKPTALNFVSMVIVHKGDASTYQYKLGINSSNKWRGSVYIGATTYDLIAPSAATVGQWDHLVLARSGTSLTLYVNGVSVASSTISASGINAGSGALALGRKGGLAEDYFNGAIDEVAVYGTALAAERVSAHYSAGRPSGFAPQGFAPLSVCQAPTVTPTSTPTRTPTSTPTATFTPTVPPPVGGCNILIGSSGANVRRGPSIDDLQVNPRGQLVPANTTYPARAKADDEVATTWYGFEHPSRPGYLTWVSSQVSAISGTCNALPLLNTQGDTNYSNVLGTSINTLPISTNLGTGPFRGFGISDPADYSSIPSCRHPGLDFFPVTQAGVSVLSISNGIVVGAGDDRDFGSRQPANWGATQGGFNIVVRTGGHFILYGHLQEIDASLYNGASVSVGSRLGILADRGGDTHIHIEIRSFVIQSESTAALRTRFGAIKYDSTTQAKYVTDVVYFVNPANRGTATSATSVPDGCTTPHPYSIYNNANLGGVSFGYTSRDDVVLGCFNVTSGLSYPVNNCISPRP